METNGNGKPHHKAFVAASQPPPESIVNGEYDRSKDFRLDQIIKKPEPKYTGLVPVIIPHSVSITLLVVNEEGSSAALELSIPESAFDGVYALLHGKRVIVSVRNVRPEKTEYTLEPQRTPTGRLDLDDNKYWKD